MDGEWHGPAACIMYSQARCSRKNWPGSHIWAVTGFEAWIETARAFSRCCWRVREEDRGGEK